MNAGNVAVDSCPMTKERKQVDTQIYTKPIKPTFSKHIYVKWNRDKRNRNIRNRRTLSKKRDQRNSFHLLTHKKYRMFYKKIVFKETLSYQITISIEFIVINNNNDSDNDKNNKNNNNNNNNNNHNNNNKL